IGGEYTDKYCCGDDDSEYKRTRICLIDACTSDPNDDACCFEDNKCVYNDVCYANTYVGDIDSDDEDEVCNNGIWTLFEFPIPELLEPENNAIRGMGIQLFDWTDVPNATKYELSATKPDQSEQSVKVPNSQLLFGAYFWNTNLVDGDYIWKVRAFFDLVPGEWSETRNLTKSTTIDLIEPLNNSEVGLGNQYVDWTPVQGAEKYELYVVRPDDLKYNVLVKNDYFFVPATFWDPQPLGEYHWKVRAYNSGDYGPYSDTWIFTKIN
ncbi:MAG: hypothetical protein V1672_00695, partial [Candidatus Diapherotrites archaeon]